MKIETLGDLRKLELPDDTKIYTKYKDTICYYNPSAVPAIIRVGEVVKFNYGGTILNFNRESIPMSGHLEMAIIVEN